MKFIFNCWLLFLLLTKFVFSVAAQEHSLDLSKINLPSGFKISVFASGLSQPRSLAVDASSQTVFVGSRLTSIYTLSDFNQDGVVEQILEFATNQNFPNGVAIRDKWLYVGENQAIRRWNFQAESASSPPTPLFIQTINNALPQKIHHGLRYIKFGPDQKLYVALGTPCNICLPQGIEGTIIRMNADGTQMEIVAKGVRNSVGFDWHPQTNVLFFTDNGADFMGDDIPPDELNQVTRIGANFGFPYLGGKNIKLTGFQNQTPPKNLVPPVLEFQAHTANLGLHFYRGTLFPPDYRNDAFVAQHGSWNRSTPVGYRIMRIRFDDQGQVLGKEVFADGWLQGETIFGRPVDITELKDGSLLVSDDGANVIYRITYDN